MHDNLNWYRRERARALSELRGVPQKSADEVVPPKNAALADAARELANALDLVDLQMDRLRSRQD